MLVTDVQLNLHNSGSLNLLFQDKSGENASGASCEFNLQAALLHGLLHLIEQALKKAQWQQPDFRSVPITWTLPVLSGQLTNTDRVYPSVKRCLT